MQNPFVATFRLIRDCDRRGMRMKLLYTIIISLLPLVNLYILKLLIDVVEPLSAVTAPRETRTEEQIARDADTKLYLRLKRDQLPRIQEMLARMKGDIPVYINLPEEKITLLCPRELWVDDVTDAQATLLSEMKAEDMKAVRKA